MAQLFDYFVCPRSTIEQWISALEQQDDELRDKIESEMPQSITLQTVGQEELNILAGCARSEEVDTVKAVAQVDLVKALTDEEGPWVVAFPQPTVEAIAEMNVNPALVHRWIKAVSEYQGNNDDSRQAYLTTDAALTLKKICTEAVQERLYVFTCFY
ncbi:MAG TPA: hypothetical protein V6C97_19180 [Oculatellaceae cyanobacterium]